MDTSYTLEDKLYDDFSLLEEKGYFQSFINLLMSFLEPCEEGPSIDRVLVLKVARMVLENREYNKIHDINERVLTAVSDHNDELERNINKLFGI